MLPYLQHVGTHDIDPTNIVDIVQPQMAHLETDMLLDLG